MHSVDVLTIIAEHDAEIRSYGVQSLALFGSVARDEAGPDSDIDFLVEFEEPVGLFTFGWLQNYLASILGQPVDLVATDAIKKQLRERILKEVVTVSFTSTATYVQAS